MTNETTSMANGNGNGSRAEVLTTRDGIPLKVSLAKALRREKMRSLALIAPLLIFILITFAAPIADMLFRSVENGIVSDTLPKTVEALQTWEADSPEAPGEPVFRALYEDLLVATEEKTHTRLGSRLNYESSGMSSLFRKTGRRVGRMDEAGPFKEQFVEIDDEWGELETWQVLKRYSPTITPGYFLNAADMELTAEGVALKPENERIYLYLFARTLFLSLTITFSCLLLGYPVAFLLAALPARTANLLMILVLLPFWTSLLVRTSAWKVLLQQQGVINDFLVAIGIAAMRATGDDQQPDRHDHRHDAYLLPFMILPLYSVMKTVSPSYVRAAKSLGATDWTAFWRVYFPQTVPGIGAGSILVFILAIGYYITPELVGGTSGIFISNRIAYHISSSLNWGLAAALGVILLAAVMLLFYVYDKIVGIDNVKLG